MKSEIKERKENISKKSGHEEKVRKNNERKRAAYVTRETEK